MNGPTRSSSFQGRPSVEGGTARGRSTAVLDELDQFVDSEPTVWPASQRRARPAEGADYRPRGRGAAQDAVEPDVDAAFSRTPASSRRDMFAQKLDAALTRTPKDRDGGSGRTPQRGSARADDRPSQKGAGALHGDEPARHSHATGQRQRDEEEDARRRQREVFARSAAEAVSGSRETTGRAGAGAGPPQGKTGDGDRTRNPQAAENRRRIRESWQGLGNETETSVPDPGASEIAEHDVVEPRGTEEPEDALDWEIGNAIRGIVNQNRPRTGDEPNQRKGRDSADGTDGRHHGAADAGVAQDRSARTGKDDSEEKADEASPPQPAAPVAQGPIGTKRAKPIPTFRYQRADDAETAFPSAPPPDMDDPLSSVFFSDARTAFSQAHAGAGRNGGGATDDEDADADIYGAHLSELDQDDDEFDPDAEVARRGRGDDETLPPSLSRAARRRRGGGPRWRTASIAAVVSGVAIFGVLGVFGIGLFTDGGAATQSSGEPPVIRADARDVKERPAETESATPPGVMEQTELTGDEVLSVPERMRIESSPNADRSGDAINGAGAGGDTAEGRQRVRTVVVRPDGSIVPVREDETADTVSSERSIASLPEAARGRDEAGEAVRQNAPFGSDTEPTRQSDNGAEATSADPLGFAAAGDTASRVATETDRVVETGDRGESGTGSAASAPGMRASGEARADNGVSVPVPRQRPDGGSGATSAGSERRGGERQVASAAATGRQPDDARRAGRDSEAPWGVQLASRRSRSAAERSFSNLQAQYPRILRGLTPMITRADVGSRGTFYRVRVPAQSRGEAAAFCQRLKAAGADCFIDRN